MTELKSINATTLLKEGFGGKTILDVRTPMEHAEKHLSTPHKHIPLDELIPEDFMRAHAMDVESGIYMLCRSGVRAAKAAEKFIAAGFPNVHVIEGGIIACEAGGHPVAGHTVKNCQIAPSACAPKLSLERQVRIAAGLISGIGAALALLVNPLFALIPLGVGCGLVFAGVTDRCGLALVLTHAPWNRIK